MEATASAGRRRIAVWLFTAAAAIVVAGVFLQAFSIAAYVRGAGQGARDLHETGGFLTHSVEFTVFLLALIAFWGAWRRVGFALLLPLVGTLQMLLVGDTDKSGGWVNGLHGLFALVVLLLAAALVELGRRALRGGPRVAAPQ